VKALSHRIALGLKLGFNRKEAAKLAGLKTPERIQDFINKIPVNFEPGGDTCLSAREVLRQNRAHCIEAAFLAAAALYVNGFPPLLMDMRGKNDWDHVVALFQRDGCWGAISKSNHLWHRWRDPVYKTQRELIMSYFNEYVDGPARRKTLWDYSVPFDLSKHDPALWATNEDDCWKMALTLDRVKHFRLITNKQAKLLRKRDNIEAEANKLLDFKEPKWAKGI
jgi:hypothetical protein